MGMSELEKKTFSTQEGPNRGRDKPGPDRERPAEKPTPKPTENEKRGKK